MYSEYKIILCPYLTLDWGRVLEKGLIHGVSRRKDGCGENPREKLDPGSIQERVGSRDYPGQRIDPVSIRE